VRDSERLSDIAGTETPPSSRKQKLKVGEFLYLPQTISVRCLPSCQCCGSVQRWKVAGCRDAGSPVLAETLGHHGLAVAGVVPALKMEASMLSVQNTYDHLAR
jgi:hypothetical protein